MTLVLMCGSRTWDCDLTIRQVLAELRDHEPVHVIHGGAKGADAIVAEQAPTFGYDVTAFPADWKTHGKAAGPIRNRQMLDQRPDMVLAFRREGESRGTDDTIAEARRRGIETRVWTQHRPGRRFAA